MDFEGDPRPRGMHWDIGADEAWFLGAVDSTPAMPRTLPTLAPEASPWPPWAIVVAYLVGMIRGILAASRSPWRTRQPFWWPA